MPSYDARMAEMARVLHANQDETAAFTRGNIKLVGVTAPDVQHSFGVERNLDDRLMGESRSPDPSASVVASLRRMANLCSLLCRPLSGRS